jgi:site-specific recombinase XerD
MINKKNDFNKQFVNLFIKKRIMNQTNESTDKKLNEYIRQMNEKQKKAMEIAKEHLQTSFHIVKSNGFQEWKKSKTDR